MTLIAAARWLHEASLMILFGAAMLAALKRRALNAKALGAGAALVALLSALLWFALAAAEMGGSFSLAVFQLAMTQSLFGQLFALRLVLLVLLLLGVWRGWRASGLALLSGAGLVLISFTSHAAEASPAHFTAIGAINDGLHFLAGGFWIGGLALLALWFARRDREFPQAVALFAQWGMIAVALLILTGLLNAATVLLGGEGADSVSYLAVLGAKLVLVAVMVGLALNNHFRLLPRLTEGNRTEQLGRNIRLEFVVGLVVIGLASALAQMAPTMQAD